MFKTMSIWRGRAFAGCCLAAIAGCSELESPAATPQANEPQLAEVELVHTVYFETDDARLSTSEAEALRRFARHVDDHLTLNQLVIGHADVRAGDAHNDPLSERRAASVVQLLNVEGFPPERISSHGLGRRFPVTAEDRETSWRLSRRVEVLARGIVVIEPSCPDWSRPSASHSANVTTSNFGCATAVNLIRMLADPRELVRGQSLGPADGPHAARAVERYRADEVKPLKVEGASQ
jgi:pilus biogenesis lipoprotein CpaD